MKLSRSVTYALQATLLLAEWPDRTPVPCNRLAEAGRMPERFLLQILRSLVTHGVLQSARGVDGGYVLGRPPAEISLLDLIEAVDGPIETIQASGQGLSAGTRQHLESALQELTTSTQNRLRSLTIASLLH